MTDDPTNRRRRPRGRAAELRTVARRNRAVVTQGIDGLEDQVQRATGETAARGTPAAIPDNQLVLILRYEGEEIVIGEGQLRTVDLTTNWPEVETTFEGDGLRSFVRIGPRIRLITLSLEVEDAPG